MGSATALNQLFRNLCHNSMWKYAILWKFQVENHICLEAKGTSSWAQKRNSSSLLGTSSNSSSLKGKWLLSCEDSYAIDTKTDIAMEYARYKEFTNNHPWITSFGCESIGQSGSIPSCSIAMAVFSMTQFSYLLGEGIVGKVASMERHQWICVGEMNTELLLECPDELGLQLAAGIKTILLLPVLPLGLVQLGSLDKLSEDLTIVAQLKDLFYAYQCTFYSNSTFEPSMGQIDSYMALNRPLEKYSTCLEINTNSTDLKLTEPFTMPDLTTLTFDQAMANEHLSMGSIHLPHPMAQSYDPFTQVGFHQAHGLGTELLDEIRWNAMCGELFQDHSEEQIMLNTSTFSGRTMESDQSPTLHEEVKPIPVISQGLTSKNPTMFDASMKELLQHCDDFCDFNKANPKFTEGFDVAINSTTNSRNLDFVESGLYKVMEQNCLMGWNNSTWMDNQSKANERSELITCFKAEVPETIGCSVEEPFIMEKNRTEYFARIAMEELPSISDDKELESCECAKSHGSSSGRCSDSCLTQSKTEDGSNSEDSGLERHKIASLNSDSEGFTSYITTRPQRSSVNMPLKNEDHENSACGFWRSCLKESQGSNKQVKNRDTHRARPRDRQLIQDRIRELRELIPNASKCSIDALLDQTVKHMMFLQSVPIHADKLSQSTRSKVGDKDSKLQGSQVPDNRASLACEMGTKSTPFPLVVENLDQPDQMLVEMQCRSHGVFIDIAQTIKRLGLTILKGILESRLEELWAHFIVEIPKGFHRMDIVWPLMQLLQFKF